METVRLSEPVASERSTDLGEGLFLLCFMLLSRSEDSSRVNPGPSSPRFFSKGLCLASARPIFDVTVNSAPRL
jgi:hypothetical protein